MPENVPPTPEGSSGAAPVGSDGAIAPGAPSGPPLPPGAVKAEPMNLPPIPLEPSGSKQLPPAPSIVDKKESESKDSFRELIETVVFVVVLVLMLKTFLAEAFVIPTGSMADTLLGYHFKVTCQECGYPNLVNASAEAEPPPRMKGPRVIRCQCVNCKAINDLVKGLPP